MDIPLNEEIERILLVKVAAGEYRSIADLIEEALFLLVERDWLATQRDLRERTPFGFDQPDDSVKDGGGA